ncbi:hypothetical protein VKT23_001300 [Stygiomarasmius scandens]|uniref:Uncharacterized protein n=1 Tax=Marasmiellus scandens TaxID=2682957 RepID=A0ABR1K7P3_9AGAR
MLSFTSIFTFFAWSVLFVHVRGLPIERCAEDAVDYFNPLEKGGSLLDKSAGLGEPLNVIISAKSTPEILSFTNHGFLNYARAIGFSIECLGLHSGTPQSANLGDGRGDVNETAVIRENFRVPILGTCIESLIGGNHFRVFPQTGPEANSGALFLAVSKEEDVSESHNIVPNGYDVGRDELVQAAMGIRTHNGVKYNTTVTDVTGLLQPGAEGINHGIAIDGVIKMLTVTIVDS